MFDKRLFRLAPGIGALVARKVACMWVGLLANIGFMLALVMLLQGLLAAADPHTFACDAASSGRCPSNLFHVPGTDVTPMAGDLMFYAGLAVVCALVRYLLTTRAAYLGTEAAERVKLALRSKLYRKMLALGPAYRSRVKTSDVVQSAGEGVEQIQTFFELFLPQLFYAILAHLTLFVAIAPINMPAALTMLVCAPLIIIVTGMVSMTAARAFRKYWGRYTDMGAAFLDNLQGLETLKSFDADDRAAKDMDAKAESFRVMTMRVLQIQLRSLTAMDVVAYGGAAAGIGVALWQYASGAGSISAGSGWMPMRLVDHLSGVGTYLAYGLQYLMLPFGVGMPLTLSGVLFIVLLSAEFFIPMRQLGSFFHVAMNGMTSSKRIFALLDAPEPPRGSVTLPQGDAALPVRFEHVGFAYGAVKDDTGDARRAASASRSDSVVSSDSAHDVASASDQPAAALKDVTFTARPGELTAVVGVSGSGKSTAAALLSGTITGYTGSLTVDGAEACDLTGASLARTVTLIGARSHLFSGTLRGNLTMARPEASDDELWRALGQARIADFVRTQSDGLDMPIEPEAANLSGGQRQRVAIARALLHDSPVFVFDEATSSVDADSEELILATIRELAERHGKTVIMITHRMANAERADRVVVFDHGVSVESGTHESLMAAGGRYAELFVTQASIERIDREGGQAADSAALPAVSVSAMPAASGVLESRASESGMSSGAATTPSGAASDTTDARFAAPHGASTAADLTTWQVVTRLLGEARPLAGLMAAASVSGAVGHLAATFVPVFGMAAAFAAAGNPVWGMGAGTAVALMVVCAVLRGLTRYVEQYLNHNVAFHLLAFFRSKAFAALRRLAPAKLAGKGKGDLIAMLTTDVELLEIFFAHTISPVVIAAVTTVTYAIVAATLSPWMALALVVSHLIIGVLVPRFFATGVRNLGPAIRGAAGRLDDRMLDDMRGLDEIIRFGRGEDRARAIDDRTRALWRDHARLSRVNGRFAGIGGLLVFALTGIAAWVAVAVAPAHLTAIPALVTAFVLLASSFGPTLALSALPANLTQTFAAARRLFSLMDETPAVEETGTAAPAYAGMRLDHVTFGYAPVAAAPVSVPSAASVPDAASSAASVPDAVASGSSAVSDAPVLADFSLDVPRTGILGVEGPSGRGKSTLLKLLMRYWDPQQGTVSMSGVPLPDVDAHHRRRVQALMGQETHLFDGTIRENLLIALPESEAKAMADAASGSAAVEASDSSLSDSVRSDSALSDSVASATAATVPGAGRGEGDARLRAALAKASVLDFVDSLPDGLDTRVGELGDRLSEGERQRIGLARVFLRRADLVLFDEPTSRLDALNEAIILKSIRTLACDDGAAVVLVSHRKSAMRIAHRVLAM